MTAGNVTARSRNDQMKIASFDRDSVDSLCASIQTALASVAEKHGVRIGFGKVTYRASQCSVALDVTTISPGGEGLTREAEDFKMAASFYGLTPEHLGQTFRDSNGLRFRLVGMNIKARKRPFIIADVTGKEYSCAEDVVLRGFGLEPRASRLGGSPEQPSSSNQTS